MHTWQVAVLALPQLVAVDHLSTELSVIQDLLHLQADSTISNQDDVALLHALAELGVAEADLDLASGFVLVALPLGELVSHCHHSDLLPCLQLNVLALTQHCSADLRPLGVQQDSKVAALGGGHLAKPVQHLLMCCMCPVAEVQAGDIHASIQQGGQALLSATGRAQGADDLGLATNWHVSQDRGWADSCSPVQDCIIGPGGDDDGCRPILRQPVSSHLPLQGLSCHLPHAELLSHVIPSHDLAKLLMGRCKGLFIQLLE
mmetsp:Transcript_28911/g.63761  ORF Transcript_28911/g.63761 Transcript_28911/m.63761 type:complete len:260 (+) Transcript_28911:412-1191(+)